MTASGNTPTVVELADPKLADSVVGIFDTHTQAERAVKELEQSGFDMRKVSILGKGQNKYLVIADGMPQEVKNARAILQHNAAAETEPVSTGAARLARHVSIS